MVQNLVLAHILINFYRGFWSGNDARILEKQFIRAAEIIRLNTKKQDTVFGDYFSAVLAILSDRGITFNEIDTNEQRFLVNF